MIGTGSGYLSDQTLKRRKIRLSASFKGEGKKRQREKQYQNRNNQSWFQKQSKNHEATTATMRKLERKEDMQTNITYGIGELSKKA